MEENKKQKIYKIIMLILVTALVTALVTTILVYNYISNGKGVQYISIDSDN